MAFPVLIMGASGSGKTYSLKNFKKNEVGIISVEKGRLPFKSDLQVAKIPKMGADPENAKSLRSNQSRQVRLVNEYHRASQDQKYRD